MNASLASIARTLGGDVSGRQILAPGPGHSTRDRSMCVKLSPAAPEGFIVFSHCGDDPMQCRDHVRARLGWDRPARFGCRMPVEERATRRQVEQDDSAKIARAVAIWEGAKDPSDTLVARYLGTRSLDLRAHCGGGALRFHPACPWRDSSGRTVFVPAMVAAMRSIATRNVTAVHRTRLTPDGRKVDRRMLGKAGGAAIMLTPPADIEGELAIGEGVETCLSAQRLGWNAVWALGSVGAITSFPVLGELKRLVVLAEKDDGGASARAVDAVGGRYVAAGREVLVVEPAAGDLNDVLMAERRAA